MSKIKGLNELQRRIKKLGAKAEPTMVKEFVKTGLLIEGSSKRLAPVDKGLLRNSINMRKDGNRVYVGVGAHYGAYVEYGTVRNKAQPYLIPAYRAEIARMIPRLNHSLGKLI